MTTTHPDYRCHGCNQPIEPLAAIRVYHGQCDPWGRMEHLERVLRDVVANYATAIEYIDDPAKAEEALISATLVVLSGHKVLDVARAALARQVQMKGRE